LLDHLREVVSAARAQGLTIFFVPHNRWEPGDYVSFEFPSPYQLGTARAEVFAKGSWGGTFHDDFQPQPGDVVAHEHWGSGGFANTDLDLQLRQLGVRRIILIGLIANTCIEATGRHLEVSERAAALGVRLALRDALPVEVGHLLDEVVILQQNRPIRTDS
jgi:nicotinamidase-related amidase